jgi:hypothetical protein
LTLRQGQPRPAGSRSGGAHHRHQPAAPAHHRDVALLVGARVRHAQPFQFGDQHRRRVAVVVAGPDRDQRQPGLAGLQEARVGIGAAVVGHLEDVGAQVGAAGEQVVLGLDLGVARQQDPHAGHGGPQHHRGVVRVRAGTGEDVAGAEHVEVDLPGVDVLAGVGLLHPQVVTGQQLLDQPGSGGRFGQR